MKLLRLINKNHEDNEALFDINSNKIIMTGDYDNDHIDDKIDGFLECLDYLSEKYTIKVKYIDETNTLFKECSFY